MLLNSNLYKYDSRKDDSEQDLRSIKQIFIDISNHFLIEKVVPEIQKKIEKVKDGEKIEIGIEIPIEESFLKSKNIDIEKLHSRMERHKNILSKNFNNYIDKIIDEYKEIDKEKK